MRPARLRYVTPFQHVIIFPSFFSCFYAAAAGHGLTTPATWLATGTSVLSHCSKSGFTGGPPPSSRSRNRNTIRHSFLSGFNSSLSNLIIPRNVSSSATQQKGTAKEEGNQGQKHFFLFFSPYLVSCCRKSAFMTIMLSPSPTSTTWNSVSSIASFRTSISVRSPPEISLI